MFTKYSQWHGHLITLVTYFTLRHYNEVLWSIQTVHEISPKTLESIKLIYFRLLECCRYDRLRCTTRLLSIVKIGLYFCWRYGQEARCLFFEALFVLDFTEWCLWTIDVLVKRGFSYVWSTQGVGGRKRTTLSISMMCVYQISWTKYLTISW